MAPAAPHPDAEIRCNCGRLRARRVEAGIEVKCRRCNRSTVIRVRDLPGDGSYYDPPDGDE
jgi:hypothetical protein